MGARVRRLALPLILCLAFLGGRAALRAQEPAGPSSAPPSLTLRLVFGLRDAEPTDWSGSVAPAGGLSAEGWYFLQGDTASPGGRWTLRTRLAPAEPTPLQY